MHFTQRLSDLNLLYLPLAILIQHCLVSAEILFTFPHKVMALCLRSKRAVVKAKSKSPQAERCVTIHIHLLTFCWDDGINIIFQGDGNIIFLSICGSCQEIWNSALNRVKQNIANCSLPIRYKDKACFV